jgi:hypothetical protein
LRTTSCQLLLFTLLPPCLLLSIICRIRCFVYYCAIAYSRIHQDIRLRTEAESFACFRYSRGQFPGIKGLYCNLDTPFTCTSTTQLFQDEGYVSAIGVYVINADLCYSSYSCWRLRHSSSSSCTSYCSSYSLELHNHPLCDHISKKIQAHNG